MSPFQALYGKVPTLVPQYQKGEVKVEVVDMMLFQRQQVLNLLKTQLQQAQLRMKNNADKKRQERTFQVGDKVLLKLQPYRQLSVARRANHKLAKRYFGPFPVEKVISPVAYLLTLPKGSMIHPTFHVSLLKPFFGKAEVSYEPLPVSSMDNKPIQQPVAVLATRQTKARGRFITECLVQWSSIVPEDASWVELRELKQVYPELNLEDKVTVLGEAVDTKKEGDKGAPRRGIRLKGCPTWAKDYMQ
ncbi:uncharacterized protein LOC133308548 [Gastrolobium bilobum]|uniref:uncharacterized protein LOC133308548 n=1 Tax=Gastrolobium bilobum TaxID=150636 RepID=UPI002AB2350F|nr:uncharacterized protein LOC133308548 [Gastrolobium bilobum]